MKHFHSAPLNVFYSTVNSFRKKSNHIHLHRVCCSFKHFL